MQFLSTFPSWVVFLFSVMKCLQYAKGKLLYTKKEKKIWIKEETGVSLGMMGKGLYLNIHCPINTLI